MRQALTVLSNALDDSNPWWSVFAVLFVLAEFWM